MNEEQDRFIKAMHEYNNIVEKYFELIVQCKEEIYQLTNLLEEKYKEVVEDDLPF